MDQLSLPLPLEADPVPLPAMSDWERMVADYGLMHLSVRFHPLGILRPYVDRNLMTVAGLQDGRDGRWVAVAGLVVARQRPGTAKGFVFLLLEDETGLVNVVIPPDLYERCRDLVRTDPLVTVRGRLQKREGTINLLADEIASLQLRPSARVTRPLLPRPRRGARRPDRRESGLPRGIGSIDQARLVAPPARNFA